MTEQVNQFDIVINFFRELPPERERAYEKDISGFCAKHSEQDYIDVFYQILFTDHKYAFEAFFCLATIYRRNKDYNKLYQLLEENKKFRHRISYNHIRIMYLVHSESLFDYDDLLEEAYHDAQMMYNHSGYVHTFCNTFATICEQCNEEEVGPIIEEWSDKAMECIDHVLALESTYAKFFCTKARILNLRGNYTDAVKYLLKAINIENSERADYALAISNYQYYRLYFTLCKQKMEFQKQIDELKRLFKVNNLIPSSVTSVGPHAYVGNAPYIFVSYAHLDKDLVFPIIEDLQKHSINVWFDDGIHAGKDWTEEIATHLEKSTVIIVMLTNQSINSRYVRTEVVSAFQLDKRIIPIFLEDVILSSAMNYQLGAYQKIYSSQYDYKTFIDRLITGIQIMED